MAKSLLRVSYADLQAELRRRERSVGTLERKRDKIAAKLREREARIALLGGAAGGGTAKRRGGGRGRARNEMTLTETLGQILKNKTMSVTDAAAAVQDAGYRTNSSNFRTQVNIALIKSGQFKRMGRGEYTAK